MELWRIVVLAPWQGGMVIRIPLMAWTRTEPRMTALTHVWTEHFHKRGEPKV
jgi:hypothetical protein